MLLSTAYCVMLLVLPELMVQAVADLGSDCWYWGFLQGGSLLLVVATAAAIATAIAFASATAIATVTTVTAAAGGGAVAIVCVSHSFHAPAGHSYCGQ